MTAATSIFLGVQHCLADQCVVAPATLTAETPLETLGIDSLERVELTLCLEKHFGVTLGDQCIKQCRTIGDITTVVQGASETQTETSGQEG